jgi:hypothetical protein
MNGYPRLKYMVVLTVRGSVRAMHETMSLDSALSAWRGMVRNQQDNGSRLVSIDRRNGVLGAVMTPYAVVALGRTD